PYSEMRHDHDLSALYRGIAEALGRSFVDRSNRGAGSSDMGNVSLALPSIHPTIGIDALPPPHPPPPTPSRRSTTSPSSPPSAPPRPPTRRSSTAPSPWPGPPSTPRPTRPCASGCWPVPGRGPDPAGVGGPGPPVGFDASPGRQRSGAHAGG